MQISYETFNNLYELFTDSPPTLTDTPRPTNTLITVSSIAPINSLLDDSDDIYIQCQPTDENGEVLSKENTVPDKEIDNMTYMSEISNSIYNNVITNTAGQLIIGIILIIVIFKLSEFVLNKLTTFAS